MKEYEKMPWIGDSMRFPHIGDEGFDEFEFTPRQVEMLYDETRKETQIEVSSEIIRKLSDIDMCSDLDFLKAVAVIAENAIK